MLPDPPLPHDAAAERLAALDGIYRELLADSPPDPDADEQPDRDGASAEAAA